MLGLDLICVTTNNQHNVIPILRVCYANLVQFIASHLANFASAFIFACGGDWLTPSLV